MTYFKKILFGITLPAVMIAAPIAAYNSGLGEAAAATVSVPPSVTQDCTRLGGTVIIGTTGPGAPEGTAFQCLANNVISGVDATLGGGSNFSILQNYAADGTPLGGGGMVAITPSGTATTNCANGKCQTTGSKCGLANFNFQDCIWFPLMAWLGSWFLTFGAFLLWVAGGIFDLLIQHVIIAFGDTINNQLKIAPAINIGWSVFRDVANIAIIGMFVFIAISIILGLKEYGQQKLVARVIIVAVLINFSLLFTKMIVDFSNFTAYQFYKAMPNNTIQQASDGTGFDVAGAFLKPVGITSIWNTYCLTRQAGGGAPCDAKNGTASPAPSETSGWRAFFYGLAGGAMLAGVAAVLIYGCFHIASRAIAIIFLMVTASVAFASYLVPKFSDGDYGWKAWWGALLNVSVFAPLLMIFLFISLTILNTATQAVGGNKVNAALAGLAGERVTAGTGPAFSDTWTSIFIYIIVVGLLFASFKIASHFASKIGTGIVGGVLNFAGAVATGGVGLLAGRVAAPILQRTVGKAYAGREEARTLQLKEARDRSGTLYNDLGIKNILDKKASARTTVEQERLRRFNASARESAQLARRAENARRVAASKMNVMDTRPAKALAKRFGLKGVFSGETAKGGLGYGGRMEAQAKEIAKIAERLAPTEADRERLKIQAEQRVKRENANVKTNADSARANADAQKQVAEDARKNVAAATKVQQEADGKRDAAKRELDQKLIDATRTKAGYAAEHAGLDSATTDHDRIAKTMTDAIRAEVAKVQSPEQRRALEERTQTVTLTSPEEMKRLREDIVAAVPEAARGATQQALTQATEERQSSLRKEAQRIETAREAIAKKAMADTDADLNTSEIASVKQNFSALLANANAAKTITDKNQREAEGAQAAFNNLDQVAKSAEARWKEVERQAEAAGKAVLEGVAAGAAQGARELGERGTGFLPKIFSRERRGKKVEEMYLKKRSRNERLFSDLREWQTENEPPAAPPTT